MQWGMRTERIMAPDPEAGEMRFFPERGMFDHAVPYLAGQPLDPPEISVSGVRAEPVTFTLPPNSFSVMAQVGSRDYEQPLCLEEVLIDLRDDTVELCYRRRFHYAYVPRERRHCVLRMLKSS